MRRITVIPSNIIFKEFTMNTRPIVVYSVFVVTLALALAACLNDTNNPNDSRRITEHTHEWGKWTTSSVATCAAAGEETRICALDPSHIEKQPIAALGHDWGEWEDGYGDTEERACRNDPSHTESALTFPHEFAFELINDGAAYRVKKGQGTLREVYIPTYYRPNPGMEYLPVTEIGSADDDDDHSAFGGSPLATNVTITAVYIPEGVTSIGSFAFARCESLATVTIPASVTSIGQAAFYECSTLESNITIPEGVTSIEKWVFWGCVKIESITIPEGVTSIDDRAFAFCWGLTSIHIPASVETIGIGPFQSCKSLDRITADSPYYLVEDGMLYNREKTNLIAATGTISGNVSIPEGVTSIGPGAFQTCTRLTGITIPESVTYIGSNAFYSCGSLTGITIPESVTEIDNGAFGFCRNIASITIPATVTRIGDFVFSEWFATQTVYIEGHASQAAADTVWHPNWRLTKATIKYWNGSEWVS